ncbi:hypothetical protein BH11MYX4_BH11MYX4_26720 [soil metagenome]
MPLENRGRARAVVNVFAAATLTLLACGTNDDTAPGSDGLDVPARPDPRPGDESGDAGTPDVRCNGVTCATPPPATCANPTALRAYATTGTCLGGTCSYKTTDTACAAPANADGVCAAGVCAGFTCRSGFLPLGKGCVFGIAHDTWTTVASLTVSRAQHGLAADAEGRVYAIGGHNGTATVSDTAQFSVEAFTPSTNIWTKRADTASRHLQFGAAGLDGLIYAVGYTALEAYTPATNTWTNLPNLPATRYLPAIVAAKNGIYIIGGSPTTVGVNTVYVFTPSTSTYTNVAPMPTARYNLAGAVATDGRIFAMGGLAGGPASSRLATVEAYTPSTNTWAPAASLPTARTGLAAATGMDGRIYAIGGYGPTALATVEAYTTSTNTWTTVASMPAARGAIAAAVGADGRIYVAGGASGTDTSSSVYAYTP